MPPEDSPPCTTTRPRQEAARHVESGGTLLLAAGSGMLLALLASEPEPSGRVAAVALTRADAEWLQWALDGWLNSGRLEE